jgi:hypothetical protein
MTRMIELTDLRSEVNTTVRVDRIGPTIRRWYGDSPNLALDDDLIEELHEALNAQDYEAARDVAAELGIGFDEV